MDDITYSSQVIEVEGHLIDSMILTNILDSIMDKGGDFQILEFQVGKLKTDTSYARVQVIGRDRGHLDSIMRDLYRLGATVPESPEVSLSPAPEDMILPDDFYCTTNHPTSIHYHGKWIEVEHLMMDKQIVVYPEEERAICKAIRDVMKGDLIVVGDEGIRIRPPERPREGVGTFEFMTSTASSEKPTAFIAEQLAEELHRAKMGGKKIVVVAGPAVIHTGAAGSLARMIEMGYVDALLSGNALAVHDVEYSIFGTSLGVNMKSGRGEHMSRNHIAAINEVMKAGSLKKMVEEGGLGSGIFHQCIKQGVPYALAGSIRDDGPIPDVIPDMLEAQREYKRLVKGSNYVLMLASTLHSIAVGNMIQSGVRTICVDINPAVVTKLSDRGTSQALGIVSDVGTLLPLLVEKLEDIHRAE
jgi:lysine-ketoglutarate reductase/saccharopine dehydrogenase-like protein (TIGR00300 family)